MKIIFCGFGRAGKECLLQLLISTKKIEGIYVFTHNAPENNDFIEFLDSVKVEFTYTSINNCFDEINESGYTHLLSVYYRYIISDSILGVVKNKAMNLHPSLLPDYKGTFSSVWAILNAEKETGVSFHYMTSGVDEGNIILQQKLEIKPWDTAYSLYNKLISLFVKYFDEAFDLFIGEYTGAIQATAGSYYKRVLPYNGIVDASEVSFEFAKRFVRAMYFPPFPNAKIMIDDTVIEIDSIDRLFEFRNYFIDRT